MSIKTLLGLVTAIQKGQREREKETWPKRGNNIGLGGHGLLIGI